MAASSFPEEAGGIRWLQIIAMAVSTRQRSNLDRRNDGDPSALIKLLESTLHTDATDARDKIYALLGIVERVTGSRTPIAVNYRMPVAELYRDVARFLILGDRSLRVLSMHCPKRELPGLPSWVPDWSVPVDIASIWPTVRVNRTKQYRVAMGATDNPNELVLGGKRVDIVAWVGMGVPFETDKRSFESLLHIALKDWERIVANLPKGKPEETITDAFWRTIIANIDVEGSKPPALYADLSSAWFDRVGLKSLQARKSPKDYHPQDVERYITEVYRRCKGRRLCVIASGALCLAPANTLLYALQVATSYTLCGSIILITHLWDAATRIGLILSSYYRTALGRSSISPSVSLCEAHCCKRASCALDEYNCLLVWWFHLP
jgi:hypothetical protein